MIQFTVYGRPQPQGSTRAFIPKGWTRAVITTDNAKLKPWRSELTEAAVHARDIAERFSLDSPVAVRLVFYFLRPKSARKRRSMTVRPDIDKCARACLDAFTGVFYRDDSQVTQLYVSKHYDDEQERVEVTVEDWG